MASRVASMNNSPLELGKHVSTKRRIKDLLVQKDNHFCADCNAPDPKWASPNIGVFVCLKCCEVHRNLGSHVSKVLSVTSDEWSKDDIDAMIEVGGNHSANSIYEAYIPEKYTKPEPDASHEQRENFIRLKYEKQEFLKPSLRIVSGKSNLPPCIPKGNVDNVQSPSGSQHTTSGSEHTTSGSQHTTSGSEHTTSGSQHTTSGSEHTTSGSQRTGGMVEFIGMLKVKVIRGKDLAIRDMMTSDPYVVLKLGKQTVQTSIIKSNLNPVWNEELMLAVPQEYGILYLSVFDYDLFSSDDIMGEAEIDLQPLITPAIAFGDAHLFDDMQIGKWLNSDDNALIDDSIVNIIDGKVKQEMSIKLQNVECGQLDLELEWIPLDN